MTVTTVAGWLLDTHALLWMLHGDKRLSKKGAPSSPGSQIGHSPMPDICYLGLTPPHYRFLVAPE
jgi:hypothetical protein